MFKGSKLSTLKRSTSAVAVASVIALGFAGAAVAQLSTKGDMYNGSLAPGDEQLQSGEYSDSYTFTANAGDQITVDLTSTQFDPYLILIPPTGDQIDNDDWEGSLSHSRIEASASASGTYEVLVTSFAPGETGSYLLDLDASAGGYSGSGASPAQGATGTLAPGDQTLSTGEYSDMYEFTAGPGEAVSIDLTSTQFDPYLIVQTPDGEQIDNDDYQGSLSRSHIDTSAANGGTYRVQVTSFAPGETGSYSLSFTGSGGGYNGGQSSGNTAGATGTLSTGDEQLQSGEYLDRYTLSASAGENIVVDLTSDQFDTYIILVTPNGEQIENDDYEGSLSHSRVETQANMSGEYEVLVTSFAPGETGSYSLSMEAGDNVGGAHGNYIGGGGTLISETGTLANGDDTLEDGEFFDVYPFSGSAGQRVAIEMSSSEFDTWVGLIGPEGIIDANDDAPNMGTNSRLVIDLPETAEYSVVATSYAPGETGRYDLNVSAGGSTNGGYGGSRPVTTAGGSSELSIGSSISGQLSSDDRRGQYGEFEDTYTFQAQAGQSVRVVMESGPIDTYLRLQGPGSMSLENDDFNGSLDQSVIEFRAPSTGRYTITATSYAEGETGSYTLAVTDGSGNSQLTPNNGGGYGADGTEVFGIFVGVSDYPSFYNDLPYTAQDAILAHDAVRDFGGMDASNAILLTDQEATRANLQQAFATLSARMDDDDTFVFFFSGHGNRIDRQGPAETADLDGMDETIELYDNPMTDTEFDLLLDGMPVERALIILDSCYSGGFAKDVISAPGRMGLFSSEEDVVSLVASKFEAGGYLAHFFRAALETGEADINGDSQLDAIELSQYLRTSYMLEHQSKRQLEDFDSLDDIDVTYQHLVVDRSGVSPYEVFFDLRN